MSYNPQSHREQQAKAAVKKAAQTLNDLKASDPDAYEKLCRDATEQARGYQAKAARKR